MCAAQDIQAGKRWAGGKKRYTKNRTISDHGNFQNSHHLQIYDFT